MHKHKAYLAFLGHRISGLLLGIFLPIHFYVLGLALEQTDKFDRFLQFSELPGVKVAEWGLVLLLAIHLSFGLRILIIEFVQWPTPGSIRLNWISWSVVFSVIVGAVFLAGVFGS
ncbi:MAG TPA: succinate dehydrogenase [Advenella sp.]|nr:succinate dehydrogenase [Advenella sp.]